MDKGVYIMTLSEPLEKTSASKHSGQRTALCTLVWVVSKHTTWPINSVDFCRWWQSSFTELFTSHSLWCCEFPHYSVLFYTLHLLYSVFPLVHVYVLSSCKFWCIVCFSLTRVCILYDVFSLFKIWFKGIKVLPISQSRLLSFSQPVGKRKTQQQQI